MHREQTGFSVFLFHLCHMEMNRVTWSLYVAHLGVRTGIYSTAKLSQFKTNTNLGATVINAVLHLHVSIQSSLALFKQGD